MRNFILVTILTVLTVSCTKTITKEIPVGKKYSWTEIDRFTGTEKIILSTGSSQEAVFVQQPYFFSQISSPNRDHITVSAVGLPQDISIRIPIGSEFFAYPYNDSVLVIKNNKHPISSPSGGYYNLKQIDPSITKIHKTFGQYAHCMTISKDGTLLLSYDNSMPARPYTFLMIKPVITNSYPYADTLFVRKISIPRVGFYFPDYMTAVSDYFLVNISAEGIYKIRKDGSFAKVAGSASVFSLYEWNNKVYAHAGQDRLLISDNQAESFQEYSGLPYYMTLGSFFTVKDSLVGAYRSNIYTLKWSGNSFTTRFLKDDGLEGLTINGIETLKDTVYIGTSGGLYVRPVSSFFESKQ